MKGIEDRVALVTGAGSGIGRATARRFAEEGARVAVADVVADGARNAVREIEDAEGDAVDFHVDVSDADSVAAVVEEVVESFGGLDIAHNNAGIEGNGGNITDQTVEEFDRVIERFTGGDEEAKEGLVATEPIGRMADPSEVAAAVVRLCSDEASYVTGFPMAVDGGLIAQ